MKKTPLVIAASFLSAALIYFLFAATAFAGLSNEQKHALRKCTRAYNKCLKSCPDNELTQSINQPGPCRKACLDQYYICRQKAGIPASVPGPQSGTSATPTATPSGTPGDIIDNNPGRRGPVILNPLPTPTPTPTATPKKSQNLRPASPTPTP